MFVLITLSAKVEASANTKLLGTNASDKGNKLV